MATARGIDALWAIESISTYRLSTYDDFCNAIATIEKSAEWAEGELLGRLQGADSRVERQDMLFAYGKINIVLRWNCSHFLKSIEQSKKRNGSNIKGNEPIPQILQDNWRSFVRSNIVLYKEYAPR